MISLVLILWNMFLRSAQSKSNYEYWVSCLPILFVTNGSLNPISESELQIANGLPIFAANNTKQNE